jgi:hypothetical protein
MDRRGFLASMLVACAAPAIVRADSLIRIGGPARKIQLFDGDGILMAEMDYGDRWATVSKTGVTDHVLFRGSKLDVPISCLMTGDTINLLGFIN